jgi:hypothetical protein
LSLFSFFAIVIAPILGIKAIRLANRALKKTDLTDSQKTQAKNGKLFGFLGLIVSIGLIVLMIIAASNFHIHWSFTSF